MRNENNSKMPKSLEDIFNDDAFGLLDFQEDKTMVKTEDDRLIDSFLEINAFFEKNKREPSASSMSEYGLLSKLKNFRTNEKHKKIVKGFDQYNLLGEIEIEDLSINDILNDDDFGLLGSDAEDSIFTFNHTPKPGERASTDFMAQRKPMSDKEFEKYETLFRQVHKDLKEGKRKLQSVKDVEQKIHSGRFFLMDGLLLYLENIDFGREDSNLKKSTKSRKDGRTQIIFENGTKSQMFFRSLTKQLYTNGKLITDTAENMEDELWKNAGIVSEEDVKSGWIYILQSKSKNPKIAALKDLYKIGFSTTNVKDRIKNASKEATYLFADVEVVASYKCYNLNTQNFELLLHRFFGKCCLNVDVYDAHQQRITPREWFVVPLAIIDQAAELIINGGIVNYKYDAENFKLILK